MAHLSISQGGFSNAPTHRQSRPPVVAPLAGKPVLVVLLRTQPSEYGERCIANIIPLDGIDAEPLIEVALSGQRVKAPFVEKFKAAPETPVIIAGQFTCPENQAYTFSPVPEEYTNLPPVKAKIQATIDNNAHLLVAGAPATADFDAAAWGIDPATAPVTAPATTPTVPEPAADPAPAPDAEAALAALLASNPALAAAYASVKAAESGTEPGPAPAEPEPTDKVVAPRTPATITSGLDAAVTL